MEIIFQDNVYKRKSELEDYTDIILPTFDKNPPKTLREAAVVIENLTGLKRSTNQQLFKKGYKCLKVGFLPSKADVSKQEEFINNTLKALFKEANIGKIQLFFVDASHFVMGGFVGHVWSKIRIYVKTSCGKSRYNVLGALNFVSKL